MSSPASIQDSWKHIALALIACLGVGLASLAGVSARGIPVQAQPEPPAMPLPDRLAPPPMPANPTQADRGARVYWLVCMACHGDRGQGLTDEWRSAWAPGDQNCWQSKCHAANHPPQGFQLPRYAPYVIGLGALARFETAADLHGYLQAQMPWHAPGSLQDDEYWQLTAFLATANGVTANGVTASGLPLGETALGPASAASVRLHERAVQPSTRLPAEFGSHLARAGAIAGMLVIFLVALLRRPR